MTYYAGGYYRGDYYAGGFFSNLFHGIVGIGGGIIKGGLGGFLGGGPAGALKGAVVGAATGAVSATEANVQREVLAAGPSGSAYTPALRAKHMEIVATRAGGAGAGGAPMPGKMIAPPMPTGVELMGVGPGAPLAARRAFHLNKHPYWSRTGYHPAHTVVVRNRRMNWANGRALARAERRIGSFVKHATKYLRWVHPGRKGHAVPKFGRKKKTR